MICPFLGMSSDTKTSLAFPSIWNYCHRCKPIASAALNHQKNICLTGNYEICPVFSQAPNLSMPHGLRHIKSVRPANKNVFRKIVFTIPALITVFILGGNFFGQSDSFHTLLFTGTSFPGNPSESVSLTLSPATVTPSPEQASLIIPTPSTLPRSRVTPIVTRKPHGMEEWIGINYIFLIYRVKQGWTIERLAAYYDTTAVAVASVNYKLSTPLYPGQLVIIPINQMDVSGLPQFEAYQVAVNVTVEELAAQLNTDIDQLRYFNGFGINEQLMAKEWIIVPREKIK